MNAESKSNTAKQIERELIKVSSKDKAKASSWFFKTGEGQYGFGDKFIGVRVPEQRSIAKRFEELPLTEIKALLASEYHECRLTALIILVARYKKTEERSKKAIVDFYIDNISRINNWDLVDSSASQILGNYLLDRDRKILYKFAKSKLLWERRIAIISTFAFIDRNEFEDTLSISEILLNDDEDLIHKAVGWALREVGKKSKPTLLKFLDKHAATMPRTALRYSIEHFDKPLRAKYMKKRADASQK